MMKRKFTALLIAACLLAGTASAISIGDVSSGDWDYPYVSYMVDNDIMPLESDGNFNGDFLTTRGEFVLYLWRAAGSPDDFTTFSSFTDVDTDDPWFHAVEWAVTNGITSGTSPTTFDPDLALTREQAFTFLWRSLYLFNVEIPSGGSNQLGSFHDVGDVSAWAQIPMNDLYQLGIVSGTDNGYLMPLQDVARSATAAILYRTIHLSGGTAPDSRENMATLHLMIFGQDEQYEMGYSGELTPEKLLDGLTNLTGLTFSYTHFDIVGDELRVHWAEDASFMPDAAEFTLNPDLDLALYDVDSAAEVMLDSAWKTLSENLDIPRIYFSDASDNGLDLTSTMNWSIPGDEWYSGNFADYYQD